MLINTVQNSLTTCNFQAITVYTINFEPVMVVIIW